GVGALQQRNREGGAAAGRGCGLAVAQRHQRAVLGGDGDVHRRLIGQVVARRRAAVVGGDQGQNRRGRRHVVERHRQGAGGAGVAGGVGGGGGEGVGALQQRNREGGAAAGRGCGLAVAQRHQRAVLGGDGDVHRRLIGQVVARRRAAVV